MAAMKENTKAILNYLKENNGEQITAQEIADALGLGVRSVIGSVNSFVKKEWAVRTEPVKVEIDGEKKDVRFISLTEAGLAVDPDQE